MSVLRWLRVLLLRLRGLRIGSGANLKGKISISGIRNIRIGHDFSSNGPLHIYADGGSLRIGNNVSINTNVHLGASSGTIVIGDNVMIAPNCVIRAADHGTRLGIPMREQPKAEGQISVGNDVWIGSNVTITRNTQIGDGSVVGAGSVVTRDIEAFTLAAGVPARFIRHRT
jgi:galactoside O-acetyltransferase